MLVVEYTSNGITRVVLKKDWHIGRMGLAYIPKLRNHVGGATMEKLQTALLRKDRRHDVK
jgi:hypothetical protein